MGRRTDDGSAPRGRGLSFVGLAWHNVTVKKLRLAFVSATLAIGVLAAVAFNVVDHSLRTSALSILRTGKADFTVAQKGVSDLLSSSIDNASLNKLRGQPQVAAATGVLIGTTRLNSANPVFIEIGIEPAQLAEFGVTVVAGRPFDARSSDQVMLGWRAAANMNKHVGDDIVLEGRHFRIVGLYSTGQSLGDTGTMLPLLYFQSYQRQPGQYTLVFVRTKPGADIKAVRAGIEREAPQLVTITTASDFGRADRSFVLINAADKAGTILAIIVGAIIVMTTMTITFIERIKEFGTLAAIGWSRARIMFMVVAEALIIGLIGAMGGVVLSFSATQIIARLPSLVGILHPEYTASAFWRAIYVGAFMSLLGALYPAIRAARLSPVEAIGHE